MTKTPTKALLCGALLAAVLPALDQTAKADPGTIGLETNVTGDADNVFSNFTGTHTFGGAPTVLGGGYSQTITSGLSTRAGWTYQLTFDYIEFGLSYFSGNPFFTNPTAEVKVAIDDLDGVLDYTIKDWDGNAIAWTEGAEHDLGSNFIHIHIDVDDLIAGNEGFHIQWNPVPAPGALALLGVAGLVGRRRRRN